MHYSWWEDKTWALYKIDKICCPTVWHTATSIRFHSKKDYDREAMAIINEVDGEAQDNTITRIHPMTAKRQIAGDCAMIAQGELELYEHGARRDPMTAKRQRACDCAHPLELYDHGAWRRRTCDCAMIAQGDLL